MNKWIDDRKSLALAFFFFCLLCYVCVFQIHIIFSIPHPLSSSPLLFKQITGTTGMCVRHTGCVLLLNIFLKDFFKYIYFSKADPNLSIINIAYAQNGRMLLAM